MGLRPGFVAAQHGTPLAGGRLALGQSYYPPQLQPWLRQRPGSAFFCRQLGCCSTLGRPAPMVRPACAGTTKVFLTAKDGEELPDSATVNVCYQQETTLGNLVGDALVAKDKTPWWPRPPTRSCPWWASSMAAAWSLP